MRRQITSLWLAALMLVASVFPALSANRIALVIGNAEYRHVPALKNPVNDARAVASALRDVGFTTIEALNVDQRAMRDRIREFLDRIKGGDEALVYYAGHGVEVSGANFMLPVDIRALGPGQERALRDDAVSLSQLMADIEEQKARISVVILDACRDNPFPRQQSRSLGATRGLSQIAPPDGMFIIYSAGPGQTALDSLGTQDTSSNGVFTRNLLTWIRKDGVEITELAKGLRQDVATQASRVNHRQQPGYYDGLSGQFFFRPVAGRGLTANAQLATVPAAVARPTAPAVAPIFASPPATVVPAQPMTPAAQPTRDPWLDLPFATAADREREKASYLGKANPKVFAMTLSGRVYQGTYTLDMSPADRVRKMLEGCEFVHRQICILAAVDNNVTPRRGGHETPFLPMPQPSLSERALKSMTIDPDLTPFVTTGDRGLIASYARLVGTKAAAIHRWGNFRISDGQTAFEAQSRALDRCNADVADYARRRSISLTDAGPCHLYAVDNRVVLGERATKPIATAPAPPQPANTAPPQARAPTAENVFNISKVSYVPASRRAELEGYTKGRERWSLAVSTVNGAYRISWASSLDEVNDLVALQGCEFNAKSPCFLYARNGRFLTATSGPQVAKPILIERGAFEPQHVPFVHPTTNGRLTSYKDAVGPKALAVHPNGQIGISYASAGNHREAQDKALKACNDLAKGQWGFGCVLYAVNNDIVFHRRASAAVN